MKNNGGPAFPAAMSEGMTLRDYFAAKALSGMVAAESEVEGFYTAASAAERAYAFADAMLVEREKENNDAAR